MKVLILGAGELGRSLLTALRGHDLSVLVRRPQPDLPAQNVLGDLTDFDRFGDYDVVLACTGFGGGPGFQLDLTRRILGAGVKRYFPWPFGVDYDAVGRGSGQDLWDEQLDVRNLLRSQTATRSSIVSTGIFTSFLFEPAFGVVEPGVVRALGSWENRVTVTAPEDIGRAVAHVLAHEIDGIVYTKGETLSYQRLADLMQPERRELWTVPFLESQPVNDFQKYRLAFARGRGVSWERGLDLPMLDVRGWLQRS